VNTARGVRALLLNHAERIYHAFLAGGTVTFAAGYGYGESEAGAGFQLGGRRTAFLSSCGLPYVSRRLHYNNTMPRGLDRRRLLNADGDMAGIRDELEGSTPIPVSLALATAQTTLLSPDCHISRFGADVCFQFQEGLSRRTSSALWRGYSMACDCEAPFRRPQHIPPLRCRTFWRAAPAAAFFATNEHCSGGHTATTAFHRVLRQLPLRLVSDALAGTLPTVAHHPYHLTSTLAATGLRYAAASHLLLYTRLPAAQPACQRTGRLGGKKNRIDPASA